MEPLVQGAAGMIVHPEGYLSRVAAACKAHDVLLILDEVAVGFGRTGRLFACEHEGVHPDFLCMAKGLSAGYLPLAATLTTERIFEGFLGPISSLRTFFHGHTYTGNPLACAVAMASLDLFESKAVLENVNARAAQLAGRFETLRNHAHVGNIRHRGLMAGIEIVKDRATGEPYPGELRLGHQVILEARTRGAVLRPLGNTLILMPPLSITEDELDRLADILEASLDAVLKRV